MFSTQHIISSQNKEEAEPLLELVSDGSMVEMDVELRLLRLGHAT